jgi:hypothetical protein
MPISVKMKSTVIFFSVTLLIILVGCKETLKEYPVPFAPKVVTATGHSVPLDSIQKPVIEIAGVPKIFLAKYPDIIKVKKNTGPEYPNVYYCMNH